MWRLIGTSRASENGSSARVLALPRPWLSRVMLGVCLFLVGCLGYIDYLTGYERTMLLFYLLPIFLATWFLGLIGGLAIAVLSVVTTMVSDVAAGIPAMGFWNGGMGLASFAVFAFVLSNLRTLLRELDQRVRERTAALQHEVAERERLDKEIAEVAHRERLRLGQDLHDSLCQHLTGTALTAQVLREKLARRSAPEVVEAERVVRYIEQGIDLTRNLARGFFSPELEAEGLMVALHGLAENTAERFKIACVVEGADGDGVPVRDSAMATQLYRIAQEAVTNAVKHAAARRIDIRLARDDRELTLTIADDGIGFPHQLPQPEGLGLRSMSHGAASIGANFDVRRNGRIGTIVTCKVRISERG
jgi:signal transduction histidine kinase